MHIDLQGNKFIAVKSAGNFLPSDFYDLFDPVTGRKVLEASYADAGIAKSILAIGISALFSFDRQMAVDPFTIEVRSPDGSMVLTARHGITLMLSTIDVFDEHDHLLGHIKQKNGPGSKLFDVLDAEGTFILKIDGGSLVSTLRFMRNETEIARFDETWTGFDRNIFKSTGNYMLKIDESISAESSMRIFIMAAVMCFRQLAC